MKFYLIAVLAVLVSTSCSEQSKRKSSINDYEIDFGKEYIFLDSNGLVNLEVCDIAGSISGHRCKISQEYPKIAQENYISYISSALKLDPQSLLEQAPVQGNFVNDLEKTEAKFLANIEFYKGILSKPNTPERKSDIMRILAFYENNFKLFQDSVKPLLENLFVNENHPLLRSLQSDRDTIAMLVAPFGRPKVSQKVEGAGPLHPSPETGEFYAFYQNVCWYDAMGLQRPEACRSLTAVLKHYSFEKSFDYLYLQSAETQGSVQPSCKKAYGDSFSVQNNLATQILINLQTWDLTELKSLNQIIDSSSNGQHERSRLTIQDGDGNYAYQDNIFLNSSEYSKMHWLSDSDGRYRNFFKDDTRIVNSYIDERPFYDVITEPRHKSVIGGPNWHKRIQSNYICSAPASAVDRDGDIDQDGIVNVSDKCNVKYITPDEHTLVTDVTSPRYGCYAGQKSDEEYPWLKSKEAESPPPETPSPQTEACTECSNKTIKTASSPNGAVKLSDMRVGKIPTGPNEYIVVKRTGNYDLYATFPDGSKGAWVEGQYTNSTKNSFQLDATFKR
jgi:hypothetical protein